MREAVKKELTEAREVCPTTSQRLLKEGALLVDVREPSEVAQVGHAGGEVVNIPLSQFEHRWSEVPRDRDAILACAVGERSLKATCFLMYQGYTQVANMRPGIARWVARGFPITHPGPAHTPGDSFVFVPQKNTVFTGDIVYVERLLGVGEQSSITNWPAAFEAVAATGATHVVPGHGHATTMDRARADTYDYLMNLRARIAAHIGTGGDLAGAAEVDQAAFAYLEQFDSLARRNTEAAYIQMEFE